MNRPNRGGDRDRFNYTTGPGPNNGLIKKPFNPLHPTPSCPPLRPNSPYKQNLGYKNDGILGPSPRNINYAKLNGPCPNHLRQNLVQVAPKTRNTTPGTISAIMESVVGDSSAVETDSNSNSSRMTSCKDTDAVMKKFRSLECKCCQEHFGYQSRAARDEIFCSVKCIEEQQLGRVPEKIHHEEEPKRKPQISVGPVGPSPPLQPKIETPAVRFSAPILMPFLETPVLEYAPKPKEDTHFQNISKSKPILSPFVESGMELEEGARNVKEVARQILVEVDETDFRDKIKAWPAGMDQNKQAPPETPAPAVVEPTQPINLNTKIRIPGLPLRPPIEEPRFTQKREEFRQPPIPPMPTIQAKVKPEVGDRVPRNFVKEVPSNLSTEMISTPSSMAATQSPMTATDNPNTATEKPMPMNISQLPVVRIYPSAKMMRLSKNLEWPTAMILNIPIRVTRSHSNSAIEIYVQTQEESSTSLKISNDLNILNKQGKLGKLSTFAEGTVCAAPFEGDLYRGEILAIDAVRGAANVFFSDFGNECRVSKHELGKLPERLFTIPRCINHCQWDLGATDEMTEEEKKLVYEQIELIVVPKTKIAEGQYIIGISNYLPKSKITLEMNPSTRAPDVTMSGRSDPARVPCPTDSSVGSERSLPATRTVPVRNVPVVPARNITTITNCRFSPNVNGNNLQVGIVHAWNLTRYLIGSVKDDETRETMQGELMTREFEPYKGTPIVGEIVLGKYCDGLYRGQITSINGNKVTVEFVDYGDSAESEIKDLRIPDDTILKYPIFGMSVNLIVNARPASTNPDIERAVLKPMTVEIRSANKERPHEADVILWLNQQVSLNAIIEDCANDNGA